MNKKLLVLSMAAAVATLSGCGSNAKKAEPVTTTVKTETVSQTRVLQKKLSKKDSELAARDNQIAELKRMLAERQNTSAADSTGGPGGLLPPHAKPGECYARVFIPPTYKTESVEVLKKEGYDIVEVVPAQYGYEEKTVMTKEATEVLTVIPAVYGWKEEKVLVAPEIKELRKVPAKYANKTEKVLIKPAHKMWKEGSGPITRVDASTGEIMCLVEVPAVYETYTTRVLVSPETTKEVVVKPAQYRTVKTKVVTTPAKTVKKSIPAVYSTVKVKKLIKPATTVKKSVKPVYGTITKRVQTAEGRIEWAPILCETNITGDVVRQLQAKLNKLGYNAGAVDSVYGWQTTAAVKKYQKDKGLAVGALTFEVLDALGIKH